jgi:hypothetical protein
MGSKSRETIYGVAVQAAAERATEAEVKCLGCDTHRTVALDIVRRPKTTPVHELTGARYAYKRSHLVALRTSKISATDPPSTWWPGER